jgi:cell division septation protein DedD
MNARVAFGLIAALMLAPPVLAQKSTTRIVCWTDENGRRACGDHVPPKYAPQERQIVDSAGRVVETQAREKTPEEVAAEQERKALDAELKKREKERAAYDRFLLDTYASAGQLERARNDRVAMLDGRIGLARKAVDDGQKDLDGLYQRRQDAGDKVPPKLEKKIKEIEHALVSNRAALQKLNEERVGVCESFGNDIARYVELKGSSEPYQAECPQPPPPPTPVPSAAPAKPAKAEPKPAPAEK